MLTLLLLLHLSLPCSLQALSQDTVTQLTDSGCSGAGSLPSEFASAMFWIPAVTFGGLANQAGRS